MNRIAGSFVFLQYRHGQQVETRAPRVPPPLARCTSRGAQQKKGCRSRCHRTTIPGSPPARRGPPVVAPDTARSARRLKSTASGLEPTRPWAHAAAVSALPFRATGWAKIGPPGEGEPNLGVRAAKPFLGPCGRPTPAPLPVRPHASASRSNAALEHCAALASRCTAALVH
jgi:hypothetical protein